jgi:signal transduction histidine kinase
VSTALVGGRADAVVRESRELETDLLLASAPIVDDPRGPIEVVGAVRITLDVERVSEAVGRATWAVVAIGLASLVAGLIVALALARTLTRPLTKLAAAVRRLGSGDLTARADLHVGPPEVDELGRTFDEMAARVQRSMHAQQAFVANASHQLRTPLTAVKLRIEQAEGRVDDPEVHGILDDADRDIDRLSTTVDRMLRLAREIEEGPDVSADLVSAAHAARERWRPVASAVDANVTVDDVGPVFVRADRDDLDQLLDVVIENAVSHGGREVELRAEPGVDTSKLRVVDDGPGIPPDERDAVFQRFARGSATTAAGSGLGLTIARDLVERRGGTISIEGAEQRGTTIVVELPSSPPHP